MSETELEAVRALKSKATAERNRGRLDRAQQRLDDATAILKTLLSDGKLADREAQQVRGELADTFGMKGGVFRRMSDLPAALKAYSEGLVLERQVGSSTYNLGNVIALSIAVEGASPEDAKMREYLAQAIKVLENDVHGPRRDEWWAWADLAQFYLLDGKPDKARESYVNGRLQAGPSKDEVNRHVTVLRELAEQTAVTAPSVSAGLQAAVRELAG